MSTVMCSYVGCSKRFPHNGSTTFFGFPVKDKTRCHKWILHCGNSQLLDVELRKLKNRRVCQDHFDDSAFPDKNYRKRILKTAIPIHFEEQQNFENKIEVKKEIGYEKDEEDRPDFVTLLMIQDSIPQSCNLEIPNETEGKNELHIKEELDSEDDYQPLSTTKRKKYDDLINSDVDTDNEAKEILEKSEGNVEDEYENFSKQIALKLRQLPKERFIMLKKKIQELITNETLDYISPNSTKIHTWIKTEKE